MSTLSNAAKEAALVTKQLKALQSEYNKMLGKLTESIGSESLAKENVLLQAKGRQLDYLTASLERLNVAQQKVNTSASAGVTNVIPNATRSAEQERRALERQRTQQPASSALKTEDFEKQIKSLIPESFSKGQSAIISDMTAKYRLLGETMETFGKGFSARVVDGNLKIASSLKTAGGAAHELTGTYNVMGKDIKNVMREAALANEKFAKAFALAKEAGFRGESLSNVNRRGTSGVHELQFRQTSAETGINQRLDVHVDKMGNVIPDLSRQFKTFTQGVVRNTRELLKWTLAMGVVYAPLNQLNELFTLMIANETKLAESMIAVNESVASSEQVFDGVYVAAKRAGEGVSGTLDAFTQAYRASGRAGDSTARFGQSLTLLDDSLTLSKLSTLDQASAIDTLTAALYQTDLGLDQGIVLLDKWVHVSKYANVDLAALSTGFSVLGNTAGAAGLGIDELNGLIAAISTTTGVMSSSGIANVAKALVGTYTTPSAMKELERVGISVRNLAGDNREYLDVMREISQMRTAEIISDSDFSRITLALGGGGVRRQKDVAALLEQFSLVDEVTAISSQDSGDSQKALAVQLDTVQTSTTRLSNAFQLLANNLGSDGGALDSMSLLLDVSTKIVEVFAELSQAFGKAGPALYSMGLMAAYVGKRQEGTMLSNILFGSQGFSPTGRTASPGRFTSTRESMSDWAAMNLGGKRVTRAPLIGPLQEGERRPTSVQSTYTGGGMTGAGKMATGFAVGAIPAISNISKGDYEEAAANMMGGALGAAIGGSALWAMAGVAIAEAFVRTTMTYDTQFENFFAETYGPGGKPDEEFETGDIALTDKLTSEAFKAFSDYDVEIFGKYDAFFESLLAYAQGVRTETGGLISPETAIMPYLKEFKPEVYEKMQEERRDSRLAAGLTAEEGYESTSAFTQAQKAILDESGGLLSDLATGKKEDLLSSLISGDIKTSEYTKKTDQLGGFSTKAAKYAAAYGEELKAISDEINTNEEMYESFLTMFIDGSAEQTSRITALIDETIAWQSILDTWDPDVKEVEISVNGESVELTAQQIADAIAGNIEQAVGISLSALQSIALEQVEIPDIAGDMMTPRTQKEADVIYQRGLQIEEARVGEYYSPDLYEAYKKEIPSFRVATGEEGQLPSFTTYEGLSQQDYLTAQEELIGAGDVSAISGKMGVQQLDIGSERAGELQSALDWAGELLSGIEGYEMDTEKVGVIYSDYITDVLHADNLQMRLAMQKLVDINQKQLDGMYNIPEGATFWVPLTAASYGRGGEGGAGFGAGIPSTEDIITDEGKVAKDYDISDEKMLRSIENQEERDARLIDEMKTIKPDLYTPTAELQGTGIGARPSALTLSDILENPLDKFDAAKNFGKQFQSPLLRTDIDTAPTTKLELSIKSSTQLLVDGRIMATIVKQYLESDLLRAEESTGSVRRNVVI